MRALKRQQLNLSVSEAKRFFLAVHHLKLQGDNKTQYEGL